MSANGSNKMSKVYSPDITPFGMEGKSGATGILLSFVVAPIRLVSRVIHNICILPANLLEEYANALIFVSGVMLGLGIVSFFVEKKWCLLVSQIPALYIALRLKAQARRSVDIAEEKREVDIDLDLVTENCSAIYNELDKIIKE